jgi:4,4'-diaponeurosporenoate glycosyltransferase
MAAPGARPAPVAFGPCLATTRDALERAGGFTAVRGALVEDVELARAYRRAGLDVRCAGGGRAVRFRMYPSGLASLVEGWTKNLAAGAGRAPVLPTLGAVVWVAALAVLSWARGGDPPPAALWAAWVAVSGQLWWMLRRLGSFHWACAVAFPVPLVAFIALFARSALRRVLRRPVTWRGRRIEHHAKRAGAAR